MWAKQCCYCVRCEHAKIFQIITHCCEYNVHRIECRFSKNENELFYSLYLAVADVTVMASLFKHNDAYKFYFVILLLYF